MHEKVHLDEKREHPAAVEVDGPDVPVCTHSTLRRAARQLGRLYDEALAPTDLKSTQIGLLWQIASLGGEHGPTLQALAEEIGIGISGLTYALRPLVRDGLVELRADEHDRRTKHAALTAVGRNRLNVGIPLWQSVNQRVDTVLGSASAKQLRALAEIVTSKAFAAAFEFDRTNGRGHGTCGES